MFSKVWFSLLLQTDKQKTDRQTKDRQTNKRQTDKQKTDRQMYVHYGQLYSYSIYCIDK
jgi:hypothetical protein